MTVDSTTLSHLETEVSVADDTLYHGEDAGAKRAAPEYRSSTAPREAAAAGSVVQLAPTGPVVHGAHVVAELRS